MLPNQIFEWRPVYGLCMAHLESHKPRNHHFPVPNPGENFGFKRPELGHLWYGLYQKRSVPYFYKVFYMHVVKRDRLSSGIHSYGKEEKSPPLLNYSESPVSILSCPLKNQNQNPKNNKKKRLKVLSLPVDNRNLVP